MENDEYKSNFEKVDSLQVTSAQRSKLLNEINGAIIGLRGELERTKYNLFKDDGERPQLNVRQGEFYQGITCEDKMLHSLQEESKSLSQLVSLASEIFLLSNKFKYQQPAQDKIQVFSENEYQNVL